MRLCTLPPHQQLIFQVPLAFGVVTRITMSGSTYAIVVSISRVLPAWLQRNSFWYTRFGYMSLNAYERQYMSMYKCGPRSSFLFYFSAEISKVGRRRRTVIRKAKLGHIMWKHNIKNTNAFISLFISLSDLTWKWKLVMHDIDDDMSLCEGFVSFVSTRSMGL